MYSSQRCSISTTPLDPYDLFIPVVRLDIISHRLGLFISVVVMVVRVVGGSNIVHSVDTAAFVAPFKRSLSGHLKESAVSKTRFRF